MADPARLVAGITSVASLPTIFTRLNDAINDPRSTTQELSRIINEDTAISARILRVANSALYNFPSRIDTISQAIMVIGVNQLRDLVLACSVTKLFKDLPENVINMELFWRHSLACGVAARIVAGLRRETNVERFFVAGLLHDIGRLVLFSERGRQMVEAIDVARSQKELLFRMEKEVFGFDHAAVGGELLRVWKLPVRLVEAVSGHHRPGLAKQFPVEAAVVHLADVMTNALGLGTSGEQYVPPLNRQSWEQLALSADLLPKAMEQTLVQFDDAVKFILNDQK